ncbi:MAG: carbon-nitrogen hydrolase family protein [Anaerolineae bacterium]
MRAALVVHEVTRDVDANRRRLLTAVDNAAAAGADLVLLPEAALTGLVNTDDPTADLALGEPVPGPFTAALAERSRRHRLYVAGGVLERDGNTLYDSAVMLGPDGELALRYRRIQPQWHGRDANPTAYGQGSDIPVAETRFGRLLFLICGDLFDQEIVGRARNLRPDYVLFPFARCFRLGVDPEAEWAERERASYAERAAQTGASVLMANYVAEPELMGGAFGGALVVSPQGAVIAEWPLRRPGMLIVDLGRP